MPLSMSQRLSDHVRQYQAAGGNGCHIADVDQNIGYSPPSRGGSIPTLVTHGTLISLSKKVLVTAYNHLAFQGVPIYPHVADAAHFTPPFQDLLDSFSGPGEASRRECHVFARHGAPSGICLEPCAPADFAGGSLGFPYR